ncbi:MAG: putative Ig domain-containing protein, partial [Bacteroidota bacterium]|nr:putative Ig domain-containing protein [Bacteroidota bacterium]
MKTRLLSLFVFCSLAFSFTNVFAVTIPVISYSPSVFNLTTNVSAGTNTPVNTGGAVTTWAINPALPAGLAFSTVTGVINGTPTVAAAGATYTITGTNASGTATTTIRLSVGLVNNWTGATSTAWALAGNWSGGIPAATDNVQIGVVTYSTRQPALIANATVNSITFGPNTGTTLAIPTLTITGAAITLTVNNALTVNESGTLANPTLTGTGNVNIAPGATLNVNAGKILYTTLT